MAPAKEEQTSVPVLPKLYRYNYITDESVPADAASTAAALPQLPTYPKFPLGYGIDNCVMPFDPQEHLLDCGHVVLAINHNEPCSINCQNVAAVMGKHTPGSEEWKKAKKSNFPMVWEHTARYCRACEQEVIAEWRMKWGYLTATGNQRKKLREHLQGLWNKNHITTWVLSPMTPVAEPQLPPSPPPSV